MTIRCTLAVLLVSTTAAAAQGVTSSAPAPDRAAEALVARTFETARARSHLRRLSRIADRTALRQIVCSAAASESSIRGLLTKESQADSSLFALHANSSPEEQVRRVAEYDDRSSAGNRKIARYSVAAFRSSSDPDQTWVGVGLYWGRLTEYVAVHFSRSYTAPDLRQAVVPACRDVR